MPKAIDLKGKVFDRWTVKSLSDKRASGGSLKWICVCECGTEKAVKSSDLIRGASRSCGCLQMEALGKRLKHGHNVGGHSPTYTTWHDMKRRCTDPNHVSHKRYYDKDITVCDKWLDFGGFLEDMGERPEGKTLDRIDNDGNYELSNCRWATPKEQANNMSRNRYLEYEGERLTISQWADRMGLPYGTLITRVRRGWSTERALITK